MNADVFSSNLSDPSNVETIRKMKRDMNFVAIVSIIFGSLSCLSIIGAITGVPMIIAALRLKEAAAAFDDFINTGNTGAIAYAFERQSKCFNLIKILFIIGLVLIAIYIIVIIALLSSGVLAHLNSINTAN